MPVCPAVVRHCANYDRVFREFERRQCGLRRGLVQMTGRDEVSGDEMEGTVLLSDTGACGTIVRGMEQTNDYNEAGGGVGDGGGGGLGNAGAGTAGDLCVVRPALTVSQRARDYHYQPQDKPGFVKTVQKKVRDSCACSGRCVKTVITSKLPILTWLPSYNLRQSLLGDIIAGVTVAIMHIPQGMAYALLAGLPPITGLYMAFFPLLVYSVLGTSRHCSMGTFAVVCLMTRKVVEELATAPDVPPTAAFSIGDGGLMDNTTAAAVTYTPVQVAAAVALMIGIVQVVLGLLQLGSLCVFLSDMLVSGFTTGAAVHVMTSQIKYLFGLQVQRYNGPLKIIYTYKDIISQLLHANPAAMVISGLTIATLAFNNEVLKPWVRTKTKIPVPIELLVVIGGTVASYFGHLNDNYNIRIVGEIPTGIPAPTPPPFELLPKVVVDSIVISIVAYTVSYSMSKIFAKKHNYQVDATQELYALGISNVFGSFFGCGPIAASLSRSLIQEAVGGATQITSFICCGLIVLVLLFIGPVFETLPNCVLSSIIVVALKGMFLQVHELKRIWKVSRMDASIWLSSFLGVVIIDIDYGLLIGIIVSLVVLLCRSQQPKTARFGHIANTDLYLDVTKYSSAVEIPSVSIFHFGGPVHFANTEYFRTQLETITGLNPSIMSHKKKMLEKEQTPEQDDTQQSNKEVNGSVASEGHEKEPNKLVMLFKNKRNGKKPKDLTISMPEIKHIIIEMSSVSYIDSSAGKLLVQLYKDYNAAGISFSLAASSENVLDSLEECEATKVIPSENIFHSTHDAVTILTCMDSSATNSTKL
ncbi:prestin-like isoform X1 [Portunus trituberculatus]|uniref:prestin-like isoform X1 n=1 Tax=Portunus trituberculatus TaxID=210409 RepID=UPI001E1CC2FC|nr:prestin-like isoform X1 [Portunus trituberculatus]